MEESPAGRTDESRARHRWESAGLLVLGLLPRIALIVAYPAVHGGDSIARLARSNELVLAYQLPLPQLLVYACRALAPDPVWTRLAFALVGAAVAPVLASVLRPSTSLTGARCAGVLAALHPLLLYYSLVPYQEGAMLLLLLLGARALQRDDERAASLFFGLACLCRYEAWIAVFLAIAGRRRHWVRALCLFGWAPLLWVLMWRGLSPAGTYVLDLDPAAGRLHRLPILLLKLREYSGDTLLVLAAVGAIAVARRPTRAWAWGAAFTALFLAVVAVAGHEFPPGSGRVSERLAHVPALALCALAGVGLGAFRPPRAARLATAVALAVALAVGASWVHRARQLVAEANRDPSLRLAVRIARFADEALPAGRRLVVFAPPVPEDAVLDYVEKVRAAGGDARRAREIAAGLASHAPDADRIAAHLARPPGTVVEGAPRPGDWMVVYDDAPAPSASALTTLARETAGSRAATVYRSGP
jgi:hypothetical protein